MAGLSTLPEKVAVTFPAAAIETSLRDELSTIAREDAAFTGRVLPADPAALGHTSIELDSLRVVSILCHIDELVGFRIKDAVVKDGGYGSIDGAVRHLMPRIRKEWEKRRPT